MSADGGSVKNTLGSESSCSSGSCGEVPGRRKKEYGRNDRKTVRILTVLAYILCVSLAAVLLSAYYVFIWNPGPIPEKSTGRGVGAAGISSGFHSAPNPPQQREFRRSKSELPPSKNDLWEGGSRARKTASLHSYFAPPYYGGNTRAYQQHQIPTPLPLLITTHFLTTPPPGVPTTKPTTTTPTPPIFKLEINPVL